jgi:hypothetical protein
MLFKMKRVPIEDATDEQIREYTELQGVDVDGASTRAGYLALLSSVHDKPWVLVADVPESISDAFAEQIEMITAEPQQRLEGGIGDNDPKVRLKIGKTSYPGGTLPVSVGVNGRVVVIQRDMTVDLPYRYLHALENAVVAEVSQNLSTGEITESQIQNYPVSVLVHPDAAEVRAWRARVDNELMPA